MRELFRHLSLIDIRFVDLDAFGHVNNAHYLTYLENARVRYFDEVTGWDSSASGPGIILAHASIDYLLPIRSLHPITLYTRCTRIGTKSLTLDYLLVDPIAYLSPVIARAKTVLVAFDYLTHQTIPVPDRWKQAILSYETTKVEVA